MKKRREFLSVASDGVRSAAPSVVVQLLARPEREEVRIGYTVTRKVGNAVVRNRTRRRMREAFKIIAGQETLMSGDFVLIGRRGSKDRAFLKLVEDLRGAIRRGKGLR